MQGQGMPDTNDGVLKGIILAVTEALNLRSSNLRC